MLVTDPLIRGPSGNMVGGMAGRADAGEPPPRRAEPLPRSFPLTIIARDPSITDERAADPERRILRSAVQVPASRLEPGPRGPRFHVVDFDATTRKLREGYDLAPGARPAAGWGFVDRFREADD